MLQCWAGEPSSLRDAETLVQNMSGGPRSPDTDVFLSENMIGSSLLLLPAAQSGSRAPRAGTSHLPREGAGGRGAGVGAGLAPSWHRAAARARSAPAFYYGPIIIL